MAETRCRSCNELIRFERTPAGRLAPISLTTGQSHFIDCPQRREWRKAPAPTEQQGSLLDAPSKPTEPRYPR